MSPLKRHQPKAHVENLAMLSKIHTLEIMILGVMSRIYRNLIMQSLFINDIPHKALIGFSFENDVTDLIPSVFFADCLNPDVIRRQSI
jgi:hypothetical protein